MGTSSLDQHPGARISHWFRMHGPRTLASIGFVALHVLGGGYALIKFPRALFVQWFVSQLPGIIGAILSHLVAPVWFLIPLGLLLTAVFAGSEVWKSFKR